MERAVTWMSPVGVLCIVSDGSALLQLNFEDTLVAAGLKVPEAQACGCAVLESCIDQLREYFEGSRQVFDIPLNLKGTQFRNKVWEQLQKIGYGQTLKYGDIAKNIGSPAAHRAVGNANHNNPISIIVPCHRVIAAGGKLAGYGGGVWRKQWLLDHEKNFLARGIKSG